MNSFSATGRKRDGVLVALALDHQGQAILAILLATAMAATLVGFRVSNAVSQGRSHPEAMPANGSQCHA